MMTAVLTTEIAGAIITTAVIAATGGLLLGLCLGRREGSPADHRDEWWDQREQDSQDAHALCPYTFRDERCGYTGPAQGCDKSFDDCRALRNEARFGGLPRFPEGR